MTSGKRAMDDVRGFFSEFKRFALKGNVFELAIAVIVGNSFTQVVNSLVSDIITPLLGLITGNGATDFKRLSLTLHSPLNANGAPLTLNYGSFIQTLFNFILITLSIFLIIQLMTSARRRFFASGEENKQPVYEKSPQERLLEEIRDLLKKKLN